MAIPFLSALMSQAIMLPEGPTINCCCFLFFFPFFFGLQGNCPPSVNCCIDGYRGFAAAVSLVFFYIGPLSTLVKVVRHKDSSSLNPPFSIMVFLNVVMWLSYGLVRDPHSIPHALGLSCAQSLMRSTLMHSTLYALNPSCTHSFMHSLLHALNNSCSRSFMHSIPHRSGIMHSIPHVLTPSCTQSLVYSTLYALNPSRIYPFMRSIPHPISR